MKVTSIIGLAIAGFLGLLVLFAVLGSWYTVDEGYRGVIVRNGAVTGVADPGLSYKLPIITAVTDVSIQTQKRIYENLEAYSRDQQVAQLRVTVSFRFPADKVADVYTAGGEEAVLSRFLDPRVFTDLKSVFGNYTAQQAIQNRGQLVSDVTLKIQNAVTGPLLVESVQIEDISFSAEYENAIEERMKAEIEVERKKQEAARAKVEAEIAVTQAQAIADSNIATATAEAEAIRLKGDAEAQAIAAKGAALRANPELVSLVTAEKWDGILPTTMLPGGTVPFVDVGQQLKPLAQ